LSKNLVELCSEAKNSVLFKPVWLLYGFRASVLSIMISIKPQMLSAVRAPGIAGMLFFVWAAFKYATRVVIYEIYFFVSRGTLISTKVGFRNIATWNTYVAPVLSSAFWWLFVAFVLTAHYLKLVQYLGFAHVTGMTFSW
jgi:hypothetical protein